MVLANFQTAMSNGMFSQMNQETDYLMKTLADVAKSPKVSSAITGTVLSVFESAPNHFELYLGQSSEPIMGAGLVRVGVNVAVNVSASSSWAGSAAAPESGTVTINLPLWYGDQANLSQADELIANALTATPTGAVATIFMLRNDPLPDGISLSSSMAVFLASTPSGTVVPAEAALKSVVNGRPMQTIAAEAFAGVCVAPEMSSK